jgi:hypothetical protein
MLGVDNVTSRKKKEIMGSLASTRETNKQLIA